MFAMFYLSASYGVVERLSHKVFDHASTTEFRKHICENSDLSIKIAIATQISVRNKTDRHSFDNICQGVSYVWQGYRPTFDKGIVQRLARVLSNVWQSFFQSLTKVLSNVWQKYYPTFDKNIIKVWKSVDKHQQPQLDIDTMAHLVYLVYDRWKNSRGRWWSMVIEYFRLRPPLKSQTYCMLYYRYGRVVEIFLKTEFSVCEHCATPCIMESILREANRVGFHIGKPALSFTSYKCNMTKHITFSSCQTRLWLFQMHL